MAANDFIIRIVLDAQSKIAPVMEAVAGQVDRVEQKMKGLSQTTQQLDRHTQQLDGHVAKARDTLRSINPTLDAFDRKIKSASGSMTVVNRNFRTLEDVSKRAGGALGGLAAIIERLETKLNQLDRKMTEMGARKYKPELEVQTAQSEAKIDALLMKLVSATRQRHTFQTDAEVGVAERKIESLRRKLRELGQGARADRVILDVEAEFDEAAARTKLRQQLALARTLEDARRAAERPVDIRAILQTGQFNAEFNELRRKLFELANIDVQPSVHLGSAEFEVERRKVEAQLLALGLKRADVKVVLDYDVSALDRAGAAIGQFGEVLERHGTVTFGKLLNVAINTAIFLSGPLLSSLTAVAGALIAVGTAAGQAAAGLGGLAAAGAAQAIPVLGLLAAAFSRVSAVMKVAELSQKRLDDGNEQGAAIDLQRANALDTLRNAHEGVAAAQDQLAEAHDRLADAQANLDDQRRQGIRTLQDLVLAEQRASLRAADSEAALTNAVATGAGGSIRALQLQARSDRLAATRQRQDTRSAIRGGVENLPAVLDARSRVDDARDGIEDARLAVERANRAVDRAQRGLDAATVKVGAAADAYQDALNQLSSGERTLLRSIERFKDLLEIGTPLREISDTIVESFARALDRVVELVQDPAVLRAFQSLADEIAASIDDLAEFLTTGPMRDALIFFAEQATENLEPVTGIIESLISLFTSVARAASGPFGIALRAVDEWLSSISEKAASPGGQSALAQFFTDALEPIRAFLELGGAVLDLFLALMGPGGGAEAGTRGIEGLTERIRDATRYIEENADEVREFFDDAITSAGRVFDVVVEIGAALVRTFDPESVDRLATFMTDVVIPAFEGFITVIDEIVKILLGIANTMPEGWFGWFIGGSAAAFLALTRFHGLFKGIAAIITSRAFTGVFGTMLSGINRLIARIPVLNRLLATTTATGAGTIVTGSDGRRRGGTTTGTGGRRTTPTPAPVPGPRGSRLAGVGRGLAGFGLLFGGLELAQGGDARDAIHAADPLNVLNLVGVESPLSSTGPLSRYSGGKGWGNLLADITGSDSDWDRRQKKIKDFSEGVQDAFNKFTRMGDSDALRRLAAGIEDFVSRTPEAAEALNKFADAARNNANALDKVFGDAGGLKNRFWGSTFIRGLDRLRDEGSRSVEDLRTIMEVNLGTINRAFERGSSGWVTAIARNLGTGIQAIRRGMRDGTISTEDGMREIERITRRQMGLSRDHMDNMSEEGRRQLARNFRLATDAVEQNMSDATGVTREGMRIIKRLLADQLEAFGIDPAKARRITRQTSDSETAFQIAGHGPAPTPNLNRRRSPAGGGYGDPEFVGMPGERGDDKIPAWLGRGEAVLNWAHQKIVNPALQRVYGFDLPGMFRRVRGMHGRMVPGGYAGGGYVQGAVDPGHEPSLIRRLFSAGYQATSALRAGDTDSHHGSGNAWDFGDSVNNLRRLWPILFAVRSQLAELGGPTYVSGGRWYRFGTAQNIAGSNLQRDHEDHIHVAITNAVRGAAAAIRGAANVAAGAAAPVVEQLRRLQVEGPNSALRSVVQAALDNAVNAANSSLRSIARDQGGATGAGNVPLVEGSTAERIFAYMRQRGFTDQQSAGWVGNFVQESGLSTSVVNGIGAAGLAQWLGGRRVALNNFARERGTPWTALQTQLDFVWHELMGSERAAYQAIKAADTVAEATNAIAFRYERMGAHEVGDRINPALAAFRRYADKYATGGEIPGQQGQEVPIIAHAKEWVLNKGQQSKVARWLGVTVDRLRSMLGFTGGPTSFAGGGQVLGVGDSLLVGTGPNLRGADVFAEIGRTSTEAVAVLKRQLKKAYEEVILDVGTNDANARILARNLRRAHKLLSDDQELVVSTVEGPGAAAKNRAIRRFARRNDNVTLVDWAGNNRGLLAPDGIHATAAGYERRAQMFQRAMGATASAAGAEGGGRNFIPRWLNVELGRIAVGSDTDIRGAIDAFDKLRTALRKMASQTEKGMRAWADAIDRFFDPQSETNPFTIIENAIQTQTQRFALAMQRARVRILGTGNDVRARRRDVDPETAGRIEVAQLGTTRRGLQEELGFANRSLRGLRRQLRNTDDPADRQVIEGRINTVRAQREVIQQNLADNATQILDRQEQLQRDILDDSNSFFERLRSRIERRRSRNDLRGRDQANIQLFAEQEQVARDQIGSLRGQLREARRSGNRDLAQQIRSQIRELTDEINAIPIERVQALIDLVDERAQDRSEATDRRFRVAEILGVAGTIQKKIDAQIFDSFSQINDLNFALQQAEREGSHEQAEAIRGQIADVNANIVELVVNRLRATVDEINQTYDRADTAINQRFRPGEILGVHGTSVAKIDAQIANTQGRIGALQGALNEAVAIGDQESIYEIQTQIADLNNSIVELTAARLQAVVDEINQAAQRRLASNDVQQRLAQLGVAPSQVHGGFNIAALGRTNFAQLGQTLAARGDILRQQRDELQAQVGVALAQGNVRVWEELTAQIESLNVDLIDNTRAIRDNTDAAFQYRIQQAQQSSDFFLGLNSAAGAINDALGALSGVTDTATARSILDQRGDFLRSRGTTDRTMLAELLNSVAPGMVDLAQLLGLSGNALAPFLTNLAQNGALDPNVFSDAQLEMIRDLMNSILSNEQALIDNTKAIKDLDGSVSQTFSSTAWQMFRQAIFTGNTGLLPQYQIPQAHTGALVTKSGIIEVQAGEVVKTPAQQAAGGGDTYNVNITNPTETADTTYIGQKIAWAKAGAGRK